METEEEFRTTYLSIFYLVSRTGKIKRHGLHGNIIKTHYDRKGYLKLSYRKEDSPYTKTTAYLHRIVAIAFLYNPLEFKRIKFIDGNKSNCHVDNLAWY